MTMMTMMTMMMTMMTMRMTSCTRTRLSFVAWQRTPDAGAVIRSIAHLRGLFEDVLLCAGADDLCVGAGCEVQCVARREVSTLTRKACAAGRAAFGRDTDVFVNIHTVSPSTSVFTNLVHGVFPANLSASTLSQTHPPSTPAIAADAQRTLASECLVQRRCETLSVELSERTTTSDRNAKTTDLTVSMSA